jgi:lysophospholipase L1-like esterase
MPPAIQAPDVLPEGGQAHFGKRLEEVSQKAPVSSGTILIGDSITEAWMWQADKETYPFNLPVGNHGVSWDVTEGAVLRLPLVEPSDPEQIFIKIGTNDISLGVPLEEMKKHFDNLLSGLREQEPQADIIVQSVLPRETDKLEKVAKVNAMQAEVTQKYGAVHIDLTDIFAADDGTLRSELTYDGLHLNEAGYAVWGNALLPYVK